MDEFKAAVFDGDADVGRVGVDVVFDELLDDGDMALDHFAGRDSVDDGVI